MTLNGLDRLEWDIDSDLTFLLEDIEQVNPEDRTLVIRIARAAWGRGYVHALSEEPFGLFAQSHGYGLPEKRAA